MNKTCETLEVVKQTQIHYKAEKNIDSHINERDGHDRHSNEEHILIKKNKMTQSRY